MLRDFIIIPIISIINAPRYPDSREARRVHLRMQSGIHTRSVHASTYVRGWSQGYRRYLARARYTYIEYTSGEYIHIYIARSCRGRVLLSLCKRGMLTYHSSYERLCTFSYAMQREMRQTRKFHESYNLQARKKEGSASCAKIYIQVTSKWTCWFMYL